MKSLTDGTSRAGGVLHGCLALNYAKMLKNSYWGPTLNRQIFMAHRPGNNPKRRIAQPERLNEDEKAELMRAVRYVGSGHHKRNPADYNLLRANPRPTKSLCDLERKIPLDEARHLLASAIQCGLFSEPGEGGFPKFIWSVSECGEVFEAKTDTHGTGEYHGYPLEDEDAMHKYVKSVWIERCQNAGQ